MLLPPKAIRRHLTERADIEVKVIGIGGLLIGLLASSQVALRVFCSSDWTMLIMMRKWLTTLVLNDKGEYTSPVVFINKGD